MCLHVSFVYREQPTLTVKLAMTNIEGIFWCLGGPHNKNMFINMAKLYIPLSVKKCQQVS